MMSFQVFGILWMAVFAIYGLVGVFWLIVAVGTAYGWSTHDPAHRAGFFVRAAIPPLIALLAAGFGYGFFGGTDERLRQLDGLALWCGPGIALVLVAALVLTWPRRLARTALPWSLSMVAGVYGLVVLTYGSFLLAVVCGVFSLFPAIPLLYSAAFSYVIYWVVRSVKVNRARPGPVNGRDLDPG